MKTKLNKQGFITNKNKNAPKQAQAKSIAAPDNGINFTIQQKQSPTKNTIKAEKDEDEKGKNKIVKREKSKL
jgi:hypothetical protein